MAEFIDGFFTKKPSEKAPQFIKGKVSINKEKFINWLHTQDGEWVNIDILESQKGEFYGKVDDWKPNAQGEQKDLTTSQNEPNNGLSKADVNLIQGLREQPTQNSGYDEINPENIPF